MKEIYDKNGVRTEFGNSIAKEIQKAIAPILKNHFFDPEIDTRHFESVFIDEITLALAEKRLVKYYVRNRD